MERMVKLIDGIERISEIEDIDGVFVIWDDGRVDYDGQDSINIVSVTHYNDELFIVIDNDKTQVRYMSSI